MGYDMVAVTSPGPELDELRDKDGFHCVAVPMERHISIVNDLKSFISMKSGYRMEKDTFSIFFKSNFHKSIILYKYNGCSCAV